MANTFLSRDSIIQQAVIATRLPTTSRSASQTYTATANSMFDEVVNTELSIYPYRWASVLRNLNPKKDANNNDIPSNYAGELVNERFSGGRYIQYEMPNTAIRIIGIYYRNTNDQVQYYVDSDGIHTVQANLVIRYITQQSPENFTFPFARVVELSIAERLAQLHDSSRLGELRNSLLEARNQATTADDSSRGGNSPLFDTSIFTDPRRFAGFGATPYTTGDRY